MAANLICAGKEMEDEEEKATKNSERAQEREIKFAPIDLSMNSGVFRTIGAIRVAQSLPSSLFPSTEFIII